MTLHKDDCRKEIVALDVSKVQDSRDLHSLLKKVLDFPDFYGMNWDAFWDAISGLVELPETIRFDGWDKLRVVLPEDSQILACLLIKFIEKHPSWKCNVNFS